MDHIDKIIAQWAQERPDLDVGPMELIGRIKRLMQHLSREMEKTFLEHGLNAASFDVLATLRRAGTPYSLSAGDLIAMTMVTSGTMTNRIDQLEKSGFVERVKNPDDGRGVLISLTAKGFAVIEIAIKAHVQTQAVLVSALSKKDKDTLNLGLKKFLTGFEED